MPYFNNKATCYLHISCDLELKNTASVLNPTGLDQDFLLKS